ncbi:Dabb family protein [uncultured Litoreibacter sp.]|uniref:Dabb family protein n=1 Tax=uncultured Litoreibacter sp. TaxID=1392394 RepID=UPI00262AED67|nr:Dabb family protein [uncultured Litoreibacter sp.]
MSARPNIRHVVFFSAKEKTDVARIIEGLSLLGGIPDAEVFEVRKNTRDDALSGEVDVVVYAEFASQEALTAYKSHPLYAEAIDIVRPLRDLRIAADF